MKKDKLLNEAISECEAFLLECRTYNKRINESFITNCGGKSYTHFVNASTERGILKARSLLLIRKLQAWRKNGNVE
jgi:hypothetical protein